MEIKVEVYKESFSTTLFDLMKNPESAGLKLTIGNSNQQFNVCLNKDQAYKLIIELENSLIFLDESLKKCKV